MRWFLLWGGGVLVAMVLVVFLLGNLYPKHRACESFYDEPRPLTPPESTMTPLVPEWVIGADCHGVRNDIATAHYFVALGAALIGVGFLLR